MLRRFVAQPEFRAVNGKSRDYGSLVPVQVINLNRTEGGFVEFDRSRAVSNR